LLIVVVDSESGEIDFLFYL